MPSCPGKTAAPSPERWQVAVSSLQAASSAGLQLEIRGCNKVLSNWSAIAWNGGLDGLRGLRAAKLVICKFLAEAVKQACSSLPNQHFARSHLRVTQRFADFVFVCPYWRDQEVCFANNPAVAKVRSLQCSSVSFNSCLRGGWHSAGLVMHMAALAVEAMALSNSCCAFLGSSFVWFKILDRPAMYNAKFRVANYIMMRCACLCWSLWQTLRGRCHHLQHSGYSLLF